MGPAATDWAVRTANPGDRDSIRQLYAVAFTGEDLWPLVDALLTLGSDHILSFVAEGGGAVIAHGLFTHCGVDGDAHGGGIRAALFGPLGVVPAWAGRGVGTGLATAGLERLQKDGADLVLVLGDPAFYGRLGFGVEDRIKPPYPLPDAWAGAWQSRWFARAPGSVHGILRPPAPWCDAALWGV
jgi:putative acetyltransferase